MHDPTPWAGIFCYNVGQSNQSALAWPKKNRDIFSLIEDAKPENYSYYKWQNTFR